MPTLARPHADALARAQAALDDMADELEQWAGESVARLDAARRELRAAPDSAEAWSTLHRRAHDLKGLGSTYGYPLLTRVCGSLCRMFEAGGEARPASPSALAVVDGHVDLALAVKAEGDRGEGAPDRVRRVEALEAAAEAERAALGR